MPHSDSVINAANPFWDVRIPSRYADIFKLFFFLVNQYLLLSIIQLHQIVILSCIDNNYILITCDLWAHWRLFLFCWLICSAGLFVVLSHQLLFLESKYLWMASTKNNLVYKISLNHSYVCPYCLPLVLKILHFLTLFHYISEGSVHINM